MSLQTSEEGSPDKCDATPTVAGKTDGKDLVLIPQPTDDPEDPLVRLHPRIERELALGRNSN